MSARSGYGASVGRNGRCRYGVRVSREPLLLRLVRSRDADAAAARPTDSSIKAAVVERLRKNLFTKDFDLRVDVKRGVVILAGVVDSRLAKRSAGDDCWDTVGVIDVSNQLEVAEGVTDGPEPVRDFMTTGVVALEADAPLQAAGAAMRDSDVGSVVVMRSGEVVGIVTDRDIVVRAVAEARDMTATKLGDICTDAVITVDPDDPVETPIRLMRDRRGASDRRRRR